MLCRHRRFKWVKIIISAGTIFCHGFGTKRFISHFRNQSAKCLGFFCSGQTCTRLLVRGPVHRSCVHPCSRVYTGFGDMRRRQILCTSWNGPFWRGAQCWLEASAVDLHCWPPQLDPCVQILFTGGLWVSVNCVGLPVGSSPLDILV